MRYLGIDYGSKRIGVAVSDDEGSIAFPRTILDNKGNRRSVQSLKTLVREEDIGTIILGLPTGASGQDTEQTGHVREFARVLKEKVSVPVHFENEILTTKMARPSILKGNPVDASSAALILQSYLDKQR